MSFISSFKKGFKDFSQLAATLINTLLLSLVYIVGVGLTWLIARFILRKSFIKITTNSKSQSYWQATSSNKLSFDSFFRRF